jgi:hypothetical protein
MFFAPEMLINVKMFIKTQFELILNHMPIECDNSLILQN